MYAPLFLARLLSKVLPGERFWLQSCSIQNMVGHVELPLVTGARLDLQAMYSQLALNCTYQRKMFPGLIYRPEASPVVLLCFYSGKVVITGGKTLSDIYDGWNRLWPTVKRFMTPALPPAPAAGLKGVQADGRDVTPALQDQCLDDATEELL